MTKVEAFGVGMKLLGVYWIVNSLANFGMSAHMYFSSKYPDSQGWSLVNYQATIGVIEVIAGIVLIVWGGQILKRSGGRYDNYVDTESHP